MIEKCVECEATIYGCMCAASLAKSKPEPRSSYFRVGDKVKWAGCVGEVIAIGIEDDRPDSVIKVRFRGNILPVTVGFCEDGKYFPWHQEPSLKKLEDIADKTPEVFRRD